MFEYATIFITSFSVALSGALMPGPLFTITISESARRGFSTGPLLIVGHALLELALVIAICKGLDAYLKMDPVMAATALLGGSILLWFGVDMVRTAGRLSLRDGGSDSSGAVSRNPVLVGALTSLANPYWILWWATFGLGYLMSISGAGFAGISVFFAGHIAADFAWYSIISFGISRGRSIMRDRTYQFLIRACGVFLLLFGGWFLISAKDYMVKALS
jgi:threonine/homoserine/homoserine lactone efflux protein